MALKRMDITDDKQVDENPSVKGLVYSNGNDAGDCCQSSSVRCICTEDRVRWEKCNKLDRMYMCFGNDWRFRLECSFWKKRLASLPHRRGSYGHTRGQREDYCCTAGRPGRRKH